MPQRRQYELYSAVLFAALLVVSGLLFQQLLTLMLGVIATVIAAIPLTILTDWFERRHISRPLGALVSVLLGLGVTGGLLFVLIPPLAEQGKAFIDQAPDIMAQLQQLLHKLTGIGAGKIGAGAEQITDRYVEQPQKIIGPLASLSLGLLGVFGTLLFMLITAYYMAVNPQPLINGLLRLFHPGRRAQATRILARVKKVWIGWLEGVALDMLISGVLIYLGLRLVGLDFALVFAAVSALLVVIPYFGAIIGGIFPILFALTDSPGKALLVMLIYLVIQQVEGGLIMPLIMAQRVKLHPALIAIGVVVVGQLFGIVGLLIAVPLISLLTILVEELWVNPLEEGGRAILAPPASDADAPVDDGAPTTELLADNPPAGTPLAEDAADTPDHD
jgi:predicted PurR-regulated permease PerM